MRKIQEELAKDQDGIDFQKIKWEALRKSLNGLVNKVNTSNLKQIDHEGSARFPAVHPRLRRPSRDHQRQDTRSRRTSCQTRHITIPKSLSKKRQDFDGFRQYFHSPFSEPPSRG